MPHRTPRIRRGFSSRKNIRVSDPAGDREVQRRVTEDAILARSFAITLIAMMLAAPAVAQTYPPDGPDIPLVTNSEDASGALDGSELP
jgi:hypothetical protein